MQKNNAILLIIFYIFSSLFFFLYQTIILLKKERYMNIYGHISYIIIYVYIYLYIILYIIYQERKTDKDKTPLDIILKAVRAVKVHNLSIRQVALEFNMNYPANRYCKKIPEYNYQSWNV